MKLPIPLLISTRSSDSSSAHGIRPLSSASAINPKAYTSAAAVTDRESACSGAVSHHRRTAVIFLAA